MWFFTLPEAGDIVWCRFPEEAMGRPGPKPRPALVFDLGTLHGEPAVEAIYGTSQKLERLHTGEFAITPKDGIAYRVSGLSRATKFDMSRSVFLPFSPAVASTLGFAKLRRASRVLPTRRAAVS